MSFIVKGIDMPKTGERVYAEIRPSGEVEYIAVTYDKDYTRSAKVERTNAIQIPKGHGRLIDASTKTTVKSMSGEAMDVGMLLIALKQYVPTILGAESEEQNEMPI